MVIIAQRYKNFSVYNPIYPTFLAQIHTYAQLFYRINLQREIVTAISPYNTHANPQ